MTDSNPNPDNAPAPPPAPPAPAPTSSGGTPSKDERTMAMLCHILGIPTGFLGPLIIWLIKKDTMPFVDDQGKEALNFQIMMTIIIIASNMAIAAFFIGCFLLPVALVANIVFCIMGAMKANEGVNYRYPFAIRLVK